MFLSNTKVSRHMMKEANVGYSQHLCHEVGGHRGPRRPLVWVSQSSTALSGRNLAHEICTGERNLFLRALQSGENSRRRRSDSVMTGDKWTLLWQVSKLLGNKILKNEFLMSPSLWEGRILHCASSLQLEFSVRALRQQQHLLLCAMPVFRSKESLNILCC